MVFAPTWLRQVSALFNNHWRRGEGSEHSGRRQGMEFFIAAKAIVTLCTKPSGAVYCNRSCLFVCVFVCLFVCLFVGLLP